VGNHSLQMLAALTGLDRSEMHPVPAHREQGLTKHRLVPGPVRGPVVTAIFRMRVMERLSFRRIAERLQCDPVKYPPPIPNRRDTACGRWTASAVRPVLENPKYTGYQVWNRRARKKGGNKANPVSEWVVLPARHGCPRRSSGRSTPPFSSGSTTTAVIGV
jgi:recombinase